MRYIILSIFLATLVCAVCACTESSTQWEHQRESEEKQHDMDRDVFSLEDRVKALEKRVDALEAK